MALRDGKRETSRQAWASHHSREQTRTAARLNPGVSTPAGRISYASRELSLLFIQHTCKSLRCTSLTQGQPAPKLVQVNRKIPVSCFLTQKVYNEVGVSRPPVRPLSLKVFPLEAMSVRGEQLLALLLVKSLVTSETHVTLEQRSGKNPFRQL